MVFYLWFQEIAAQYGLKAELFTDGDTKFDLQQGELGECVLEASSTKFDLTLNYQYT